MKRHVGLLGVLGALALAGCAQSKADRAQLRLSRSNVAYARNSDHAFDYDARNFAQHILELGVDGGY